jgi:hypothetical protein
LDKVILASRALRLLTHCLLMKDDCSCMLFDIF